MNTLLKNKIIFLTGGSCGIGRDCAKAYAAAGANVVVTAIDSEGVKKVASELGPNHLGIVCDVTKDAQVKAAVEQTLARFGRLNAVHNNAGISQPSKPLHETTDAEWNALFDVNLKGLLLTTRHAVPCQCWQRQQRRCILFTSSLVGVSSRAGNSFFFTRPIGDEGAA